ncbi:NADH-ubiquinone oxidoreductase-F iron-sulfur binding region domain-containing protein [Blautia wexlerae]|jgi:NAD-dependent dihydropyrimidine dehydrogenase PreA subunit|uniref:NADH-ubiquinone oxidoreductase-F iron-sulfur binding region domain-containing protein n=1 Tax=Blautia wexlerae TaxID=418240 RepID=UPI000E5D37DB|nr:4Fe-4S dicluster domain-containing protein [Ruminococcus sp. AM58-7XD]
MTTFETAKAMGNSALAEKIKAASLMEYGLYREPLTDRLARCGQEGTTPDVYAGLNNADLDGVLLKLLKEKTEQVLSGIEIAGMLTGAEKKFLYLPEAETETADQIKEQAEAHGITVVNDIINVRDAEDSLMLHIATAADLADLVDGHYEEGVYIALPDGNLKKVPAQIAVSDLVSLEGAKAVYTGYQYYTPEEAAGLKAEDVKNGVIRVLTEKDCIVSEAAKTLLKDRTVSCGRCVFCREGLIQLEYMQKEVTQARGKTDYLELTKEIGEAMKDSTLCSIGQESAKIALTAIEKFPEEYQAHIKKNKCPAGVCGAFVHIYIDPQICQGCGECMDVCPKDCIDGKAKYIHMIDEFECTKCGKCIEACEEDAIIQTAGKLPKLPNRLVKVGKFKKH